MTIKLKSTVFAAAAAAAAAGIAPAALAQSQPAAKAPPASAQPAPARLDGKKLKSFAVAYLQVDKIKREYQPRLQNAGSTAERQKIQTEASQKMVSAVNGVDDMNVQEYSSILASAQQDPKLAKKLTDEIRKTAKSGQ